MYESCVHVYKTAIPLELNISLMSMPSATDTALCPLYAKGYEKGKIKYTHVVFKERSVLPPA